MVTYREFVSVYADKCGGGADEAAVVWNRFKSEIESMDTEAAARDALTCP